MSQPKTGRMLGQFRAVALHVAVLVALFVVCVASVAEAKAPKRLPLGRLDRITATWSIAVTDCPYCVGQGQVDTASGSLTSRLVQVDVYDAGRRRVDTYGHPLPAAGFLDLGGGQPQIDPLPQCSGPDIEDGQLSHRYSLPISFTRAGDQLELHWTLPYCSGQIDGTPAQAIPARASVALSTLKQSRYSIRFVDTVPFDVVPDPASPDEHWRGTLSYDATLSFSHRCIHQRNGTRYCV
jgi:hypothetical protein